jgi:hypothetical protein
MRPRPGPPLRDRLSPVLLRHSDEQTVVGLAAVLAAAHRFGLHDVDFTDWGVIASPCRPGRLRLAAALPRFHGEGPRSASPMLVPHLSLHALSGTVSQVLHCHGLNFGVSSGSDHLAEGLQAAVAVLSEGTLPAAWLVLTAWDADPVPDDHGRATAPATCRGLALALSRLGPDDPGPVLRVRPGGAAEPAGSADLAGLVAFLTAGGAGPWTCRLDWGGCVELTGTVAADDTETRA